MLMLFARAAIALAAYHGLLSTACADIIEYSRWRRRGAADCLQLASARVRARNCKHATQPCADCRCRRAGQLRRRELRYGNLPHWVSYIPSATRQVADSRAGENVGIVHRLAAAVSRQRQERLGVGAGIVKILGVHLVTIRVIGAIAHAEHRSLDPPRACRGKVVRTVFSALP